MRDPYAFYTVARDKVPVSPSDQRKPLYTKRAGARAVSTRFTKCLGPGTLERKLGLAFTKREVEQSPEHHDPAFPVDLPSADFLAGLWPSWLHEPSR